MTIPAGIEKVDSMSFSYSANLQTVNFLGKNQPSTCHSAAFSNTHASLVIKVPTNYNGSTFCGRTVSKSLAAV